MMDEDNAKSRRGCPTYTTLMAVFLLVTGITMLAVGISEFLSGTDRSTAMITLGSLCFIPGSYASWTLLGASRGWRGYNYDSLPSYDDM